MMMMKMMTITKKRKLTEIELSNVCMGVYERPITRNDDDDTPHAEQWWWFSFLFFCKENFDKCLFFIIIFIWNNCFERAKKNVEEFWFFWFFFLSLSLFITKLSWPQQQQMWMWCHMDGWMNFGTKINKNH